MIALIALLSSRYSPSDKPLYSSTIEWFVAQKIFESTLCYIQATVSCCLIRDTLQ